MRRSRPSWVAASPSRWLGELTHPSCSSPHARRGAVAAALELARRAARGKDVSLGGGANAAQQYLAAGLVDEMEITVVPTLLGNGERLFHGVGDDLHGLELVRTVAAPTVTHFKFARR